MSEREEDPGRRLRAVRERLQLKYRDVEEATQSIADSRGSQEFAIGLSRLADIENRGTVPSIYRVYSLCATYGLRMATVLGWYGVNLSKLPTDTVRLTRKRTRFVATDSLERGEILIPDAVEQQDFHRTSYIGSQLQKWGPWAASLLSERGAHKRYAVIGLDDWAMHPLLSPGAFVQIDDRRRRPETGPWASVDQRPIYLVETREGFLCGWCLLRGKTLTVQYHPLSGMPPATLVLPDEGEVIGQVVGVAMRLGAVKPRRTRF